MPIENNMIGARIKNLRQQKMMTQKELCGDTITRNMLSSIENGKATPSVDTLMYLSKRLNISPGFLLSDETSDPSLEKFALIDSIRQAFKKGSYAICIDLCEKLPDDDEINLIRSVSYLHIAKEAFDEGRLRNMCELMDNAVLASKKTLYVDESVVAIASRYFKYANKISGTLFSETVSDSRDWNDDLPSLKDEFCRYVFVIESIREYDSEKHEDALELPKEALSFSNFQYSKHIQATKLMREGDHENALTILKELIFGQTELGLPILYTVLRDAECCSKMTNNYKDAYEFSNSCISMLDTLLKQ